MSLDPDSAREHVAVEQRGIDLVPESERTTTPRGLGLMWAGALSNVEYVVYGAVVLSLGLSLWQALVVIVVSNLSFALAGLASLQGPATGTSAFAVARAPFGPNGARGVSVFNWVSMVVYETEGLFLVALAAIALLHQAGVSNVGADTHGIHAGRWLVVSIVVVAAVVQGVLPVLGHRTILRVLRLATVPFLVLFAVMAAVVLPKVHWSAGHAGGWVALSEAFAFAVSASGLGWTIQANDYSRYLPTATSRRAVVGWVTAGSVVPSTVLMCLGAALATTFPSAASDPIRGLAGAVPGWFLVPYLAVAAVQLLAINTLDLYSSGLTLQAVGVPLSRPRAVLVDLVASAALAIATLLLSSFYSALQDLITLLIIWVAPWTAIYLVDWALRRGRYRPATLVGADLSGPWRDVPGVRGGVRLSAVAAMAGGMAAAAACIATPVFTGPVASALGDAQGGLDLSIPAGLLAAGGLYWFLERRRVPVEAGAVGPVGADALAVTARG